MHVWRARSPLATFNTLLLALALTGPAVAQGAAPHDSAVAHYLTGRIAQNAGAWDVASTNLGAALRQDPGNIALLRRTFLLSLGEGKQDDAVALAQKMASTDQGSFLAHALLVADALHGNRLDDAVQRVGKLPPDGMSPYIGPLFSAWIAVAQGDYDRGIGLLDPLSKHDGFKAIRTLQLALIEDLRGNTKVAFQHYAEAAAAGTPLRMTLLIGNFQERSGAREAARSLYQGYLAANPGATPAEEAMARLDRPGPAPQRLVGTAAQGLAEALFTLSSALQQEGALEMALLYCRVALLLDGRQPLARILAGDILAARDRMDAALAEYRTVGTGASPGMTWMARLRQVDALRRMGHTKEALELLEKMAAERPDRTDALLRLGDLHRIDNQPDAALAAYERALARSQQPRPADWALYYARGIVLDSKGKWKDAEASLKQALDLVPDQPSVLNYLGYTYVDRGLDVAAGQAMIEKALAQRPHDGFITDSLGWALFKQGKIDDAVDMLEKALELEPGDPAINDHLGDAYWAMGRRDEARFQWTRAAQQSEDDDLRKAAQAKLKSGLTTIKAENRDSDTPGTSAH